MTRSRIPSLPCNSIEIIPNRFVFSIQKLRASDSIFSFTVDNDEDFQYQPFYEDFGPLSLLQIHIFLILSINHMNENLNKIVNFYCSSNPQRVSNAALLAASFRLIHLGLSAAESIAPFIKIINNHSKPFRDASSYPSTYDLSVLSCLKGLERAMKLGWYVPSNFNGRSWAEHEMIEKGDMNWLIPNKLMAFASPYASNNFQGFYVCTPNEIVPSFKEFGIKRVIRLNNKTYDENIFVENGFVHTELFFPDGSNPPPEILQRFLDIIENEGEVVALHCKAGLGRTGTLAGCYMIKNFGFTAPEAIGWIRICRPGSIIGPQQKFLIDYDLQIHRSRQADQIPARSQRTATKKPTLSRPMTNMPRTAVGNKKTANTSSSRTRTAIHRQAAQLPPSQQQIRNYNNIEQNQNQQTKMTRNESKNDLLHIQAVGITPPVPQPRKLKRAMAANTRKTPRK